MYQCLGHALAPENVIKVIFQVKAKKYTEVLGEITFRTTENISDVF